jgi:hypothetical protein
MNWFRNIKIRRKMVVSFGLIIVLLIAISVFAAYELVVIQNAYGYAIAYPLNGKFLMMEFKSHARELEHLPASIHLFAQINDTQSLEESIQNARTLHNDGLRALEMFDHVVSADSKWINPPKACWPN